jgi:transposase
MIDLSQHAYLSDAQWERIAPHIPEPEPNPLGGRPPHESRPCLEGVLYVLVTGCQWGKLPKCFPSPSTCWRRFDEWTHSGVFEEIWLMLLEELEHLGKIDWREAAADAWFVRAKKGGMAWETPSAAKVARSWTSSIPTARRWPSTPPLPMKAK